MYSNYSSLDFDEMFENDTIDANHDLLNDTGLSLDGELLNLNSNDFNFDPLIDDSSSYDNFVEKNKTRALDFDYLQLDFTDLLKHESENNQVKLELTNSVSSTCMTDESSHPSSANSSPVSGKIRKRDHKTLDSNSDQSVIVDIPAKTHKYEFIQQTSAPNAKIYKLTKDIKTEPIYLSAVSIRHQGNNIAPYVVQKLGGNIKTVSICPQRQTKEIINNNPVYSTQQNSSIGTDDKDDQDDVDSQDFAMGSTYDYEVDRYKTQRYNGSLYHHQAGSYSGGGNINQGHSDKILFQPIQQAGTLYLSEEEKRTLLAEGYSIPTRLPLTKQDERNLKKVRRKIKNKISAQESRRKKKEYLDALEKKMDCYEHERIESKRRIELLENTQRSLHTQIRHLQSQLLNKVTGPGNTTSTGLMLFMVCFALLLVSGSVPSSYRQMNLPQTKLVSSSSLYNMGYGLSRNLRNYSEQVALFGSSFHNKLEKERSRSLDDIGIMPRQSILLGDDIEERKFEDLVLSYVKKKKVKRVCKLGPQPKVLGHFSTFNNKSTQHLHSIIQGLEVKIMDVVTNILLVK